MDIIKKLYYRYQMYCILMMLIMVMSVLTGVCNQLSIGEVTLFICFQFFCVLFPGIAVTIWMPVKNLRSIEKLTLTYASGYIFTMILYVLIMVTLGKAYVRMGFLFFTILAGVVILLKKRKHTEQPEETLTAESAGGIWILTILAVFLVSLFGFSLRWKAPYAGGINYYEGDFLFWAGDIVALTKKVPPVNFRASYSDYRYHYLGALQQAAISNVTGITVMKMAACFSYIESAVFIGLSACALVSRMIKKRTVQVLTVLLMLFSTGYDMYAGPTYIWHMYLLPMSYNIAQSLGLIVLLLLIIQLRNEQVDKCNFVLCLCCLVCCAGTKSAAGAVILCGFLFTYLYVFLSRSSKRTAYIVVSVMIGFAILMGIYLWPTVKAYQIAIRVPEIYLRTGEGIAKSVYECIDWVLGYVEEVIKYNFWTFVPAVVYGIYLLIHRNIKKEHILLLGIIAVGTMGGYFIGFYGYSQMYFTMIAYPIAGVMAGCCMEQVFSGYMSKRGQYAAAGLLCVMVIAFTLCANYKGYLQKFIKTGLESMDIPEVAEEGDFILQVSHAECEAYSWINENTESDALLLSDRTLEDVRDPAAIFAERYVFCHSSDESKSQGISCYEGNRAMIEMYAEKGVDYIVQTKRISPMFSCPADLGEIVFDNDEVAVYKVL